MRATIIAWRATAAAAPMTPVSWPAFARTVASRRPQARPGEGEQDGRSDVVVTARKRAGNLRRVPLAGTAVSDARLASIVSRRETCRGATALAGCGAALALAQAAIAGPATVRVDHGLVLDHVTVVDTRDGKLGHDMAVVIDGDRIVRVLPAAGVSATGSARLIDARGRFVVPGFLDMHAHPLTTGSTPGDLRMMLSMGVTGYRQMNGSPEILAQRRAGTLPHGDAPTLLATPGTIITGPAFASPEAAVAEVRRQEAEGADFIKAIDLPPAALFAVHAEAKAKGLIVTGHLSPLVDVRRASAEGMDGIEHLGPREAILIGCSSQEAALRADPPSAPRRAPDAPAEGNAGARAGGPPTPAMLARVLVNPIAFTPPTAFVRYAKVLDTYDP